MKVHCLFVMQRGKTGVSHMSVWGKVAFLLTRPRYIFLMFSLICLYTRLKFYILYSSHFLNGYARLFFPLHHSVHYTSNAHAYYYSHNSWYCSENCYCPWYLKQFRSSPNSKIFVMNLLLTELKLGAYMQNNIGWHFTLN